MPNTGGIKRHRNKVCDLKVEDIEKALLEKRGVIKGAAQILGCDRTQLNRRILADEKLSATRDGAFQDLVDEVETLFFETMLDKKDKIQMIFFLKCHGKERGWVERQELTGADGEPLGQVVTPVRQMDADEWTRENLKVVS